MRRTLRSQNNRSRCLRSAIEPLEARRMLSGDGRPTAALYASPISQWSSTYVFKVTYTDDTGIRVSSLGDGDVVVTAPNGEVRTARFYRTSSSTNDRIVSAWYKLSPTDGVWDSADNGWYMVKVNAGEVRDIDGNSARAVKIGSFLTSIVRYPSENVGAALPDVSVGKDVRLFGAIPDDGIDDTAAIQAAINSLPRDGDAVPDAAHPLGGIITFPKGTFQTSAPLTLPPAVQLRGQGSQTILLNSSTDPSSAAIALSSWGVHEFNIRAGVDNMSIVTAAAKGIWSPQLSGDVLSLSLTNLKLSTGGTAIDLRLVRTYSSEFRNIVIENPGSNALWISKINDWVSNVNRIDNLTITGTARESFRGGEIAMVVLGGEVTIDGLTIGDTGAPMMPLHSRLATANIRGLSILASRNVPPGPIAHIEGAYSISIDQISGLSSTRYIRLVDSTDVRIEDLSLAGGARLADALRPDSRSHVTVGTLRDFADPGTYDELRFEVRNRGTPIDTLPVVPRLVDPQRPVSSKIVNVNDFGARPNDGIDDTQAIQRAINSLVPTPSKTLSFVPGGTVLFGIGKYDVNAPLLLPSGVWLRGQGNGTVLYNTSSNAGRGAVEFVPSSDGFNAGAAVKDISIYTTTGMGIRASADITAGLVDAQIDGVMIGAQSRAIDLSEIRTYRTTIQNVFVDGPGSSALVLGDADGYSADNRIIGFQMYGSQRPSFRAEQALVTLRGSYYVQNLWIEHPFHARVLPLLASGAATFRGLWLEYPGTYLPNGIIARFENMTRLDIDRILHMAPDQRLHFVNVKAARVGVLSNHTVIAPLSSSISVDAKSRLSVGLVSSLLDSGLLDHPRVQVEATHNQRDRLIIQNRAPAPAANLVADPSFNIFNIPPRGEGDSRGDSIGSIGDLTAPTWTITWGDEYGSVVGSAQVVQSSKGPKLKIVITHNPNNRPILITGHLNVDDALVGRTAVARWRIDGSNQAVLYTAGLNNEYSARVMNALTTAIVPGGLRGDDQISFKLFSAIGTYYISQISVTPV